MIGARLPPAFDKLSPYLWQTVSVCTCIYPQYPQVQGNTFPGRRKRPHWNLTTARIARGRHPALRRLLTRSAIGLDGCIIMYSAFLRLQRDCGHVVRVLEAVHISASALVARPKGHRRKVKNVLIFSCRIFRAANSLDKNPSTPILRTFFRFERKKVLKNFKKNFSAFAKWLSYGC